MSRQTAAPLTARIRERAKLAQQRLQQIVGGAPTPDRGPVKRPAHLREAVRRHGAAVLLKPYHGVVPGDAAEVEKSPCFRFEILDEILVPDFQQSVARQDAAPECPEFADIGRLTFRIVPTVVFAINA